MTVPCGLCVPRAHPRGVAWLPAPAELCRDHRHLAVQARTAHELNNATGDDVTRLESALREKSAKKRRAALAAYIEQETT